MNADDPVRGEGLGTPRHRWLAITGALRAALESDDIAKKNELISSALARLSTSALRPSRGLTIDQRMRCSSLRVDVATGETERELLEIIEILHEQIDALDGAHLSRGMWTAYDVPVL